MLRAADKSTHDEVLVGVARATDLFGDGTRASNADPNSLWTAFAHCSKGALPELAGEQLAAAIGVWQFSTVGALATRAAASIKSITELQEQNAVLADGDWPFTVKQAIGKVLKQMPARFKLDHSDFAKCTTLTASGMAMAVAAARYAEDGSGDVARSFRLLH